MLIKGKYFIPKKYIFFSAAVFLAAAVLGMISAEIYPDTAAGSILELSRDLAFLEKFTPLELAFFIFLNNTLKALLAMLAGTFFSFLTVLFLLFNGYLIGLVLDTSYNYLGAFNTFTAIVPHGIFELTAVALACANGIYLGKKFFDQVRGKGRVYPYLKQSLRYFALVILPLLFIAAIIETFVTSYLVQLF